MSEVKPISKHTAAAMMDDGRVYFLSNSLNGSLQSSIGPMYFQNNEHDWEILPQSIGGMKIVPYGWDNRIPSFIRNVIGDNNLAPGIIGRQLGLMWGQGPQLYQLGFDGGEITQIWVEDHDIMSWLESWDYKSYLRGIMVDYLHTGGFFDAKYLERGHRIGRPKRLACLEHLPVKDSRLEWPENDSNRLSDVKHIIVGDFDRGFTRGITVYPVYDRRDPGRFPASASYNRLESFARDFYAIPQFWGAMRWIIRGSEIPTIFKYVTDNGINLAYHVHSSEAYWDYRRNALRSLHPEWTDPQVEEEIMKITVQLLDTMTQVLTGKENAGKMFHSIDCVDENGNTHKWEIEPIDQKIKDFVDSQLKISEASTSAITSGMGLHPSLSNIMVNGKLASGSEMLYAFKLYLNTDLEVAYSVILESLNQAIAFNFPGKNLRLGFYHRSVRTEESLSAKNRIKNE